MTDTDKTREKLIGSIRKTKAAAEHRTPDTAPQPPAPASAPAPAPTPSRTAPPPAAKTKAKSAPVRDPYQSGRRVWPD